MMSAAEYEKLRETSYTHRISLVKQGLAALLSLCLCCLPRRRRISTITFILLLMIWGTLLLRPSERPIFLSAADKLKAHSRNGFDTPDAEMRLLIPATQSNSELCKTILSAAILGYPTPILINWGKNYNDENLREGGARVAKIGGILEYLQRVKPEHDHDMVIVVDGYDAWFQLRPETLAYRYRQINKRLFDRTVDMIGPKAVVQEGVFQSVVFSAQKDCGPNSKPDEIACYAQPESPLRPDVYGADTDVLEPDKNLPLHFRPHWLCSGVIIGPVMDLRKMFERAKHKVEKYPDHKGSDQHVFNEIYGEQSFQREYMRLRHISNYQRFKMGIQKILNTYQPSIVDRHPTHEWMEPATGGVHEFGIGLDFGLEISQSAVLSEFDGEWFEFGDMNTTINKQLFTGHNPPQLTEMPNDIEGSRLPFELLQPTNESVAEVPWEQVPLYGNVWVGSVPAIIHMNGFKSMRSAIWDHMWYFNYTRDLLMAYSRTAHVGAWDIEGHWHSWDNLCDGHEDEVFRDGLGALFKDQRRDVT